MQGTVVSWVPPGGTIKTEDVRVAMQQAGLDASLVRDVSYHAAFRRAIRSLKGMIVKPIDTESEEKIYQVTREVFKGDEYAYTKECVLTIDGSGQVDSEVDEVKNEVQAQVNHWVEHKNTDDMTRLIQRVFAKESADLVPLRKQGGVYFVPSSQSQLLGRIKAFVDGIGGQLLQYAVGNDPLSADSVSKNMALYLRGLIEDLKATCKELGSDAPDYVKSRRYASFASLKLKVEAHSHLLREFSSKLSEEVTNAEREALSTLVA